MPLENPEGPAEEAMTATETRMPDGRMLIDYRFGDAPAADAP